MVPVIHLFSIVTKRVEKIMLLGKGDNFVRNVTSKWWKGSRVLELHEDDDQCAKLADKITNR